MTTDYKTTDYLQCKNVRLSSSLDMKRYKNSKDSPNFSCHSLLLWWWLLLLYSFHQIKFIYQGYNTIKDKKKHSLSLKYLYNFMKWQPFHPFRLLPTSYFLSLTFPWQHRDKSCQCHCVSQCCIFLLTILPYWYVCLIRWRL